MSDQELSDVVAFVKSHPPVDEVARRRSVRSAGAGATGKFSFRGAPEPYAAHRVRPPEATESVEFGRMSPRSAGVIAQLRRWTDAFGPPGWPEAANLTADETGVKGWTFEDFERC